MTERGSGKVWLVGAGPGEPDLITVRGQELLAEAEVVLFDALSHPGLLESCPQAEQIDVGKKYGERATPQADITELLIRLARAGKRVVRLKGGDPLVFARGSEEALALAEAGIPFDIVPGITSPIGAAAFAGISLTHRDLSSSVTFITGSDQAGTIFLTRRTTKLTSRPLSPIRSPMAATTMWRTLVRATTACSVVAKFSRMTIASAPESLSWCSSSRGV